MQTFSKPMLKMLAYWITERDCIREKKEVNKPKPWTKDPLLRDYRWCNVRRMDDKVSVWLFNHWYSPNLRGNNFAAAAATLARMINWPNSLALVMSTRQRFIEFDYARALRNLRAYKEAGNKVFTGAYIINGAAGGDKIGQVLRTVDKVARAKGSIVHTDSMRKTWENLADGSFPGIGSFIAGQIVADLRYAVRGTWSDRYQWAPIGPGSRRGMRRLLGLPARGPMGQAQFDELLPLLWDNLMKYQGASEVFDNRSCEAMDLQNCLCEFDKYMRLTNGEGSVRSRYPGQGDLFQ